MDKDNTFSEGGTYPASIFDTAECRGPFANEEPVGEALARVVVLFP